VIDKEKIEKIILETLPQDKTEGIYIFGSYNTEFLMKIQILILDGFAKM